MFQVPCVYQFRHPGMERRILQCWRHVRGGDEPAAVVDDEAGPAVGDGDVEMEEAVALGFVGVALRGEEAGQRDAEESPISNDQVEAGVFDDDCEREGDGAEAFADQAVEAACAGELFAVEGAVGECTGPRFVCAAGLEADHDWDVVAGVGEANDRCG